MAQSFFIWRNLFIKIIIERSLQSYEVKLKGLRVSHNFSFDFSWTKISLHNSFIRKLKYNTRILAKKAQMPCYKYSLISSQLYTFIIKENFWNIIWHYQLDIEDFAVLGQYMLVTKQQLLNGNYRIISSTSVIVYAKPLCF